MNNMIIHNPHSFDMLFTPVSYRLAKKKPHLKYQHIPKIISRPNGVIYCVVDYSESSLITSSILIKLPLLIRILLIKFELFIWKYINHEYVFKFYDHRNVPLDSVLLSFSYKAYNFVTNEKKHVFTKCGKLLSHLSHYMINTSVKSTNMSMYKEKILLLADNDFSDNEYFSKFFSWYNNKIVVIPFIVQERFKTLNKKRKNKILLSGTVHDLSIEKPVSFYSDFIKHFNSFSYHKLRSSLKVQNLDLIDNKVSDFREKNGNTLQKEYFKIDLVDQLNSYKYVCYDSELSGALALSSLEAIACGCIPFMSKDSIQGLNLVGKFNLIEFDGSVDGFIEEVSILPNNIIYSESTCNDVYEHLFNLTSTNLKIAYEYKF